MIITTNRKALTDNTPDLPRQSTEKKPAALAVHEPTPRLVLTHRPGFTFAYEDRGTRDECVTLFDSDAPGFPCNLCINLFTRQGTISSSIQPTCYEWASDFSPGELADLADQCDRLQQWFDDCATVLNWALKNYTRSQGEGGDTMD